MITGRKELFSVLFAILGAHILLNFAFDDKDIFWYMFSGSALVLISVAVLNGRVQDELPALKFLLYGVVSGIVLYACFFVGYHIIDLIQPSMTKDVTKLYKNYAPQNIWQYIALILFVIPGEEIFWRGFVFAKLRTQYSVWYCMIASSALYASVHIYSDMWVLVFAAFVAGLFWSFLYYWKKSMPLLIVSHLVFDILLFWVYPLQ
ncbi:CPBP family intramembrane metalloprotease [Bacillus carboniphilus]|uniref:CPBP family intramembrane metalloprotease n=1 Tax=Bacillus carboniphilus TaxID=86663 RepID=A0ABP3FS57_9BACI